MCFGIKLKSGFFKTQRYMLEISKNRIILTPGEKEGSSKQIVISDSDLVAVEMVEKDSNKVELEFNTKNGIYTGTLDIDVNIDNFIATFSRELGKRFSIAYYK